MDIVLLACLCSPEPACVPSSSENNKPPVADPGPEKELTLPVDRTTLDGSKSTDDQNISAYHWKQSKSVFTGRQTDRPNMHIDAHTLNYMHAHFRSHTHSHTHTLPNKHTAPFGKLHTRCSLCMRVTLSSTPRGNMMSGEDSLEHSSLPSLMLYGSVQCYVLTADSGTAVSPPV